MKVALFTTCLVDAMAPEVGQATVSVLERLGCQVDFPDAQTCCGQMHTNAGYPDLAAPLVANHLEVFADYDYVVSPSGSCAASIHHQHEWVAARHLNTAAVEAAKEGATKTFELSQFIVDVLGVTDVGAYYPHRVTYHPACHGSRILDLGDRPLALLRAVRGLDLIELPDAASCCGFGGTFALKNADVSSAMLADKIHHVMATKAESCVASDASCLMHIEGGLARNRTGITTVHLAQILASTEN